MVVPEIKKNLLSIGQLTSDNACSIEFSSTGFVIKDQLQQVLARGTKKGGLYALEENVIQAMTVTRSSKASSEVWHQRMGHPQTKSIKLLQDKKFIEVSSWMKSATVCVSCQLGKSCKLPFGLRNKISSNPLDKIHCDLWGPAPNNSTQGYKYYAVFIDDHTRYTWLYPLRRKSDFFECFLKFQNLVEN